MVPSPHPHISGPILGIPGGSFWDLAAVRNSYAMRQPMEWQPMGYPSDFVRETHAAWPRWSAIKLR